MEVEVWSAAEWSKYSERAHLILFGELRLPECERIDFALIAKTGLNLQGYVTCREWDADWLYWQYGGTFPGTQKTSVSFQVYQAGIAWAKGKYKRISTLIANDNTVMLKMAMKVGFKIVGVQNYHGRILVNHLLEF